ncbi:hypothetical protein D2A34_06465 [Clostridium chromiireducens]|uniref:Uncharacterized protein n=2 Tax=Clostridium chromiireducens TaxID=225345 RepID=A0A399IQE2_9CLOT|nr:hypothetical protein D2A34_06465 [Clostridium chromiireducens]
MLITVSSMSKLGALQDDQYLKSQVAVTAVEASKIGDELYSIIADSIINHNMEETNKEWSKMKIDKEKLIQEVIENSDTDEEKALASTANDAFHKYVDTYENKLIPLLNSSSYNVEDAKEIDGQLDELKIEIKDSMTKISISMQNELEESDNK